MANSEHLAHLKQGVKHWNEWRRPPNRNIEPDLRTANLAGADLIDADLAGADVTAANLAGAKLGSANLNRANFKSADLNSANLFEANLSQANLTEARLNQAYLNKAHLNGADLTQADLVDATLCGANLGGANLSWANLTRADLYQANLTGATLTGTTLTGAKLNAAYLTAAKLDGAAHLDGADLDLARLTNTNLSGATLTGAKLRGVDLTQADLSEADLAGADFSEATLVRTNLEKANLTGCRIYGIAAWDLKLDGASQNGLIITDKDQPSITVSDLEVAQFVYLLLFNPKIRKVIDTVTSKVVLILGRFTEERKAVLDIIREVMRHRDLVPIIFDFDEPASRDLTETVTTLAHLARFIIADITDPKCIPQELTAIIPDLPSVPVQTVILASEREYTMYERWSRFPWVLPIFRYDDAKHLLASVDESVITPARVMADQLQGRVQKPEPK